MVHGHFKNATRLTARLNPETVRLARQDSDLVAFAEKARNLLVADPDGARAGDDRKGFLFDFMVVQAAHATGCDVQILRSVLGLRTD